MPNVAETCTDVLQGLEPDILSYIIDMVESHEGDDTEDLTSSISGLLVGAEFVTDEDAAAAKCAELFSKLNIGVASTTTTPMTSTTMLLSKPKTLGDGLSLPTAAMTSSDVFSFSNTSPPPITPAVETKEKTRRKEKAANKTSIPENILVEEEMAAAALAAARSRSSIGAYNGPLEASDFTLPNPGGGVPLLERASCTLLRGRRYGLIGRNGKGKSTLLRALAARRVGNIPSNVTVHYVTQDVHLTDETAAMTPVQCVVDADIERKLLLEEASALESSAAKDALDDAGQKRLVEVIQQLQIIEADTAERRATELLRNLGFTDELRERSLSALSGGWRVRTMLAAAIFAKPDLLLLDEPTNHLSILAVLWLARELSTSDTWKERIVVVVSHDRYFIDEVCTDMLHISGVSRRLTQSHGSYSTWAARRQEQQVAYAREAALRETEIERLKEYAGHGFRYGGSASQINKMQMKAKQAEKLEEQAAQQRDEVAALQEDNELPLHLASGGELDGFLIQMVGVSFGYPGHKTLFTGADFGVTSKSRIVLLGENGNGKTTLVKLLLGDLQPTAGDIRRSTRMRMALVNQHHADQIDLTMTPLEYMKSKFPGDNSYDHEQRLRSHLASCGVTGGNPDLQNLRASHLSGGQRSRVALAAVSFVKPHVLILDEPTNNLDLESVAALAAAVKSFEGAVIVVSHDQYFVTEVANEAWVVNGGAVKRVASFEAYRKKQLSKLDNYK